MTNKEGNASGRRGDNHPASTPENNMDESTFAINQDRMTHEERTTLALVDDVRADLSSVVGASRMSESLLGHIPSLGRKGVFLEPKTLTMEFGKVLFRDNSLFDSGERTKRIYIWPKGMRTNDSLMSFRSFGELLVEKAIEPISLINRKEAQETVSIFVKRVFESIDRSYGNDGTSRLLYGWMSSIKSKELLHRASNYIFSKDAEVFRHSEPGTFDVCKETASRFAEERKRWFSDIA